MTKCVSPWYNLHWLTGRETPACLLTYRRKMEAHMMLWTEYSITGHGKGYGSWNSAKDEVIQESL